MKNQKKFYLNFKTQLLEQPEILELKIKNLENILGVNVDLFVPPFYYSLMSRYNLHIGLAHFDLQNIGKSTGSLSLDLACKIKQPSTVMVGHGEVREQGLTQDQAQRLVEQALSKGQKVLYCVGEPENQDFDYVYRQLDFLNQLESLENLCIAYEPLWAIGASSAPGVEKMLEKMLSIDKFLHSSQVPLIYGGGLDEKTLMSYWTEPFISGVLLGRMSHKLESVAKVFQDASCTEN